MSKIQHFLLVFDHTQGRLIQEQHFGEDGKTALEAYSACELEHRDESNIEIVLIGSDSIETVRLTHANYFDGSVTVSKYLAGI
jgi:hypothetical protein